MNGKRQFSAAFRHRIEKVKETMKTQKIQKLLIGLVVL